MDALPCNALRLVITAPPPALVPRRGCLEPAHNHYYKHLGAIFFDRQENTRVRATESTSLYLFVSIEAVNCENTDRYNNDS
jgi:hypothetical protein